MEPLYIMFASQLRTSSPSTAARIYSLPILRWVLMSFYHLHSIGDDESDPDQLLPILPCPGSRWAHQAHVSTRQWLLLQRFSRPRQWQRQLIHHSRTPAKGRSFWSTLYLLWHSPGKIASPITSGVRIFLRPHPDFVLPNRPFWSIFLWKKGSMNKRRSESLLNWRNNFSEHCLQQPHGMYYKTQSKGVYRFNTCHRWVMALSQVDCICAQSSRYWQAPKSEHLTFLGRDAPDCSSCGHIPEIQNWACTRSVILDEWHGDLFPVVISS